MINMKLLQYIDPGEQARPETVECEAARLEATRDKLRLGAGAGGFVPECDLGGQYTPVQCYR